MLKIFINVKDFAAQQGDFQIGNFVYQYKLCWNFVSENWILDLTAPQENQFFTGITLTPNTLVSRNLGFTIFTDGGDLMLRARDEISDAPANFEEMENNFDFVYMNAQETTEWRNRKYGLSVV